MEKSLYSPLWYRVAGLTPKLRAHLEIHRHFYRKELWYVLEDHASGRYQRFTPSAYLLVGLMDGRRTVQEIWDTIRARLGEDAPTQEEVIKLLSQLHAANALQTDVLPDTSEMLKRFEKQRFLRWKQNLKSPLFMRFSLFDPDALLERLAPFVRPLFSGFGAVLWLLLVGCGVVLAGIHWSELTENITDRVLSPGNLVVMWLVFPFLKIFHEFGHGFAVKLRGGEVHDMGVMLLVFTPIPYVDASAASAFPGKAERALVGAAGMMVEVFIAAVALILWVSIEPGPVRAVAYNIILIAGVSTLIFNGNPLLRFDAYYILADLVEMPNLGTRGTKYVTYLAQRYLLSIDDAEPPIIAPGERFWLVLYTVAAFLYRMFIYVGIILFVAGRFFFIGMAIACWGAFNMLVMPLAKIVKFLLNSPKLRRKRVRALSMAVLFLVVLSVILTAAPIPLNTRVEGVVWISEDGFIRAGTDGFIEEMLVPNGTQVGFGEPVIRCSDPLLPAQIRVLESRLQELQATYHTQRVTDRVQTKITEEEIRQVEAELADARQRESDLTIRSAAEGILVISRSSDLNGRFVRRGELVGYVLNQTETHARVVVDQTDVDLVRHQTLGVTIRLPEDVPNVYPTRLLRELPAATQQLPSPTLSRKGGGEIAIDPREMDGIKAFQRIFLFDIELPAKKGPYPVGGRVFVRFNHGSEPMLWRWSPSVRRLFLQHFNI